MATDCWVHPEQGAHEKFVGNARVARGRLPGYMSNLRTARVGKQAYSIDRKKIPAAHGFLPVFVGDSDYAEYNQIMERMLKDVRNT